MEKKNVFCESNVNEFTNFLIERCNFDTDKAREQAILVENVRVALYGEQIVHFQFVKKSTGEVRDAYGTLNQKIWHDKCGEPLPTEDRPVAVGNIRYYDTESGGWRQFTIARLIGFLE